MFLQPRYGFVVQKATVITCTFIDVYFIVFIHFNLFLYWLILNFTQVNFQVRNIQITPYQHSLINPKINLCTCFSVYLEVFRYTRIFFYQTSYTCKYSVYLPCYNSTVVYHLINCFYTRTKKFRLSDNDDTHTEILIL